MGGFDPPGGLPLAWGTWTPTGGRTILEGPVVASWGPDRLDCFAIGFEHQVLHRWRGSGEWHEWEDLGNPPGGVKSGRVAAASWGPNRLDCFVRGDNDHLWHTWWDGKWNGWHDIDTSMGFTTDAPGKIFMTSSASVVTTGLNRLEVFAVHGAAYLDHGPSHLDHMSWDGSRWSNWVGVYPHEQSMTAFYDGAAVVTYGPGHFALYAEGVHHNLWGAWWNGEMDKGRYLWRGWSDLGGPVMGPPTAVVRGSNVHVFVLGITDNFIKLLTWNSFEWRAWESIGDRPVHSGVATVSLDGSSVEVFAIMDDHRLWTLRGQSGVGSAPSSPVR